MQRVECAPSSAVGFYSCDLAHHHRLLPQFVLEEPVLPVSDLLLLCPHVQPDRVDHGPKWAEDVEEPEFSIEFSDVHRAASVRDERELPDGNRLTCASGTPGSARSPVSSCTPVWQRHSSFGADHGGATYLLSQVVSLVAKEWISSLASSYAFWSGSSFSSNVAVLDHFSCFILKSRGTALIPPLLPPTPSSFLN